MISWKWREISKSFWEINRGGEKIGAAILRDGRWVAEARHEGCVGRGDGETARIAIRAALEQLVNVRAVKRGYASRDDEIRSLSEAAQERAMVMRSQGYRVRLKRTRVI